MGHFDPAPARPRLLIADDEEPILRALQRALGEAFEVTAVDDGTKACAAVDEGAPFDCVIVDQRMPGRTGTEVLTHVLERSPRARRVLFTASDDPRDLEVAVNAAKLHAFFVKPLRFVELREGLLRLVEQQRLEDENARLMVALEEKNRALEEALHRVRENERALEAEVGRRTDELVKANADLERLAHRDALTGLHNRRAFEEAYGREIARAGRYGSPLGVLFIDVDNFKSWNDTHGHPAGDRLLVEIAQRLAPGGVGGRAADIAARYGGEEFVILLPETDKKGAVVRAERLRRAIEQLEHPGRETQPLGLITISVGVAAFPEDADDDTELLVKADSALLAAKAEGRNRVKAWAIQGLAVDAYGIRLTTPAA